MLKALNHQFGVSNLYLISNLEGARALEEYPMNRVPNVVEDSEARFPRPYTHTQCEERNIDLILFGQLLITRNLLETCVAAIISEPIPRRSLEF